jgi:hypothetical protein
MGWALDCKEEVLILRASAGISTPDRIPVARGAAA